MISVVVPCYNCATYIGEHVAQLCAFLAPLGAYEVVVVNDGSTDDTLAVLQASAAANPHVRVLSYTPNKGKGSAIKVGMLKAKGEVIIFTDADLPYDLSAIPMFTKALGIEADVVLGARSDNGAVAGQRSHRTLLSKLFAALANMVLIQGVPDTQAGFKGFTKAAAKEVFTNVTIPGFGFDVEAIVIAQKNHLKVVSMPVVLVNQAPSTVRVGSDGLKMCLDLIYIFFRYRLH